MCVLYDTLYIMFIDGQATTPRSIVMLTEASSGCWRAKMTCTLDCCQAQKQQSEGPCCRSTFGPVRQPCWPAAYQAGPAGALWARAGLPECPTLVWSCWSSNSESENPGGTGIRLREQGRGVLLVGYPLSPGAATLFERR